MEHELYIHCPIHIQCWNNKQMKNIRITGTNLNQITSLSLNHKEEVTWMCTCEKNCRSGNDKGEEEDTSEIKLKEMNPFSFFKLSNFGLRRKMENPNLI